MTLKMVGVLQQNKQTLRWCWVIRADANLYRVKKVGNYMGQNFGMVTGI